MDKIVSVSCEECGHHSEVPHHYATYFGNIIGGLSGCLPITDPYQMQK